MRADELALRVGGRLAAEPERVIAGAEVDSRRVRPGQLFVAVKGARFDGHEFVLEAMRKGASVALVERPVPVPHVLVSDVRVALMRFAASWRWEYQGTVMALTGSVGKTTTKDLLQAALGGEEAVFATRGNYNTEIGIPLALFDIRPEQRFAVFEIGMRGPGEIRNLARIVRPQVGAVTNVSMSHVGLLGGVERVAEAKSELLGALPADGLAVLPADDAWYPLIRLFAPRRLVTVALSGPADVVPSLVEDQSIAGWRFVVGGVPVEVPWPGLGALRGALLAGAVAECLGVPWSVTAERLRRVAGRPGRVRILKQGDVEILDDSYNASPVSMAAALRLLASRPGRKVAVLGDMLELGQESPRYHRDVGLLAGQVADLVVAVGDLASAYVEGARAGGGRVVHCATLAEAKLRLPELVRPGDSVLLKGARAMHLEELVPVLGAQTGS